MTHSNNPAPKTGHTGFGGRSTLGEILLEVGVITQDQLAQAIAASGGVERDLAKWLVDLGFSTEEKIMKGIGIKAKVPYFTSLEGLYTADSANLISEELARRLQVVPLFKIENVATVAMINPMDVFTIDTLVKTTGFRIDPIVCMRSTIFDAINKLYAGWEGQQLPSQQTGPGEKTAMSMIIEYSPSALAQNAGSASSPTALPPMPSTKSVSAGDRNFERLVQEIKTRMPEPKVVEVEQIQKDIQKNSEDMPIVQLVDAIFKQAIAKKASDIHIEPGGDHMEVRFRIDGVLRPVMTVPKEFEMSITARIKVMANLDITETRQPQDGRVMTELGNRPVDLRISTLPIIHGEKTVIRILDKGNLEYKLATLGFNANQEALFKETLDRPNGIVLVTGPTGSGKSTTLYTALSLLNSPERNIITLEDPVEYQMARINQVQINTKVGLTFAKGLRSVLRQDPNVIMVGEMRDQETAEIAIQSALTGHLVLSTLHTNDAPSSITRLMNMGVEPFLITASVNLIIAQRLVRVLCKNCKELYAPPEVMAAKLKGLANDPSIPMTFYRAKGCDQCNETGYKGRRGVYEIMRVTTQVREATLANATIDSIRKVAKEQGMRTLYEEGAEMVLMGYTTIEEMMRVCNQGE